MIIYKITCRKTKKLYVGLSVVDGDSRWRSHLAQAKGKTPKMLIDREIKKYGEKTFEWEVVENIPLKRGVEYLEKREQHWIRTFDSYNPAKGYNCTIGSKTPVGIRISEETKNKHRSRGNTPVHCYDQNGNFVRSYSSRSQAARGLSVHAANIDRSMKRGTICGGYRFIEATGKPRKNIGAASPRSSHNAKAVFQFTLAGRRVASYASSREAARDTGISYMMIWHCVTGSTLTAGGYVWSYKPKITKRRLLRLRRPKSTKKRPVASFAEDGGLRQVYEALSKASIGEGCSVTNISKCCHGKLSYCTSDSGDRVTFRFLEHSDAQVPRITPRRRRGLVVAVYNRKGILQGIHANAADAARACGTTREAVASACQRSDGRSLNGELFIRCEPAEVPKKVAPMKPTKYICQYNYHGKLVRVFSSINRAADAVGVSSSIVGAALNGRLLTAGGYFWFYSLSESPPKNRKDIHSFGKRSRLT